MSCSSSSSTKEKSHKSRQATDRRTKLRSGVPPALQCILYALEHCALFADEAPSSSRQQDLIQNI